MSTPRNLGDAALPRPVHDVRLVMNCLFKAVAGGRKLSDLSALDLKIREEGEVMVLIPKP